MVEQAPENGGQAADEDALAELLYDAWWQGIVDSRQSVGDKLPWEKVTPTNRQPFLRWAVTREVGR